MRRTVDPAGARIPGGRVPSGRTTLVSLAAALILGTGLLPSPALVRALPATPIVTIQPELSVPEGNQPIIAEVVAESVAVHAYPKVDSLVRRQAAAGDLLRVMGQAPGIDGDPTTWWATTEGFVPLDVLQPTTNPRAASWTLPERDAATAGWWGELIMQARVRTAATPDAPVVGTLGPGQRVKVLAEEQGVPLDDAATWYRLDGGRFAGGWVHGSTVTRIAQPTPTTTTPEQLPADGTWITVDRGARTLTLIQDGQPTFTTYVAVGKAGTETLAGVYQLVRKLQVDDMSSNLNPDALNPYYLPNVPFVQYYLADGSALHGAYWHDSFGTAESQGCVNLTITDAAYLFHLTSPDLEAPENGGSAAGTPVVIVN